MKRRYTTRVYPTGQQRRELAQLFGCTRVVRNRYITLMGQAHAAGTPLSCAQVEKAVTTELKKQEGFEFLQQVSAVPLQQAARDTTASYREFFRSCAGQRAGVGYPRRASKRKPQSAHFTKAAAFRIRTPQRCRWGFLRLPKISGELKFRNSRSDLDWASISSVTVMMSPTGVYEISVVYETQPQPLPEVTQACGVDLGLTSLAAAVTSSGERQLLDNPRYYRKTKKRLAAAQRAFARTKKGSANRKKAAARVARLHTRVASQRKDHLNKLSRALVNDNQVIGIEDLPVAALSRSLNLSTSVYDAGWAMLRAQLTYKAADAGRTLVVADRYFPSTQTCSVCHTRGTKKPLQVRTWECAGCGAALDRDFNAAVNLMRNASETAGHAASLTACGGDVRLQLAGADPSETGTHRSDRTKPAQ